MVLQFNVTQGVNVVQVVKKYDVPIRISGKSHNFRQFVSKRRLELKATQRSLMALCQTEAHRLELLLFFIEGDVDPTTLPKDFRWPMCDKCEVCAPDPDESQDQEQEEDEDEDEDEGPQKQKHCEDCRQFWKRRRLTLMWVKTRNRVSESVAEELAAAS